MRFEVLATLMLVAFFVLLLVGIPVGLTLATTGLVFGYLGFGLPLFNLLPHRIFGVVTNYTLLAIPLFVFMGVMLEKSKLAEELMDVIGLAAGWLRGGLGIGIILVGVLMGATTGIVGATVVTLGLLDAARHAAARLRPRLACGVICASGTLGQIIPPSLILILLADITNQSVGTLFAAAMMPGLLLAGFYVALCPGTRHAASGTWCRRYRREERGCHLRARSLPARLFAWWRRRSGWWSRCWARSSPASPRRRRPPPWARSARSWSRRSAGGCLSACCAKPCQATTRITAMVLFILICAQVFSLAFRGLHGERLVQDVFAAAAGRHQCAASGS